MKQNKEGISPTFILEVKNFDIKDIVYSLIDMFSVFCWDNDYKNPDKDEKLNGMLEKIQEYINSEYIKGE